MNLKLLLRRSRRRYQQIENTIRVATATSDCSCHVVKMRMHNSGKSETGKISLSVFSVYFISGGCRWQWQCDIETRIHCTLWQHFNRCQRRQRMANQSTMAINANKINAKWKCLVRCNFRLSTTDAFFEMKIQKKRTRSRIESNVATLNWQCIDCDDKEMTKNRCAKEAAK